MSFSPSGALAATNDTRRVRTICGRWAAFCFGVVLVNAAFGADNGEIVGVIDRPQLVKQVLALNRSTGKKFPGTFDGTSGKFTISGLPSGTYDCIFDGIACRLEGLNFKVPHSDYEEEQPLVDEDIESITEKVKSLNQFEDVVEILAIEGNIQHAAILLNKLRTKPFYMSKPGQVVWRAELWHFQRPEEHWLKVQDELFVVLYRERIQKTDYDAKSIMFDPELGGITLTPKEPRVDLGEIKFPAARPGIQIRSVTERK